MSRRVVTREYPNSIDPLLWAKLQAKGATVEDLPCIILVVADRMARLDAQTDDLVEVMYQRQLGAAGGDPLDDILQEVAILRNFKEHRGE